MHFKRSNQRPPQTIAENKNLGASPFLPKLLDGLHLLSRPHKKPESRATKQKLYEKAVNIKATAVDSFARFTFYTPIFIPFEYFYLDMSVPAVIATRAISAASNIFLGRLHGKSREFASKITNTDENSAHERITIVESLTSACVSAIAYFSVLTTSHLLGFSDSLTSQQWFASLGTTFLFALTIGGRYFGRFQDHLRKKFNLTPVYEKIELENNRSSSFKKLTETPILVADLPNICKNLTNREVTFAYVYLLSLLSKIVSRTTIPISPQDKNSTKLLNTLLKSLEILEERMPARWLDWAKTLRKECLSEPAHSQFQKL